MVSSLRKQSSSPAAWLRRPVVDPGVVERPIRVGQQTHTRRIGMPGERLHRLGGGPVTLVDHQQHFIMSIGRARQDGIQARFDQMRLATRRQQDADAGRLRREGVFDLVSGPGLGRSTVARTPLAPGDAGRWPASRRPGRGVRRRCRRRLAPLVPSASAASSAAMIENPGNVPYSLRCGRGGASQDEIVVVVRSEFRAKSADLGHQALAIGTQVSEGIAGQHQPRIPVWFEAGIEPAAFRCDPVFIGKDQIDRGMLHDLLGDPIERVFG